MAVFFLVFGDAKPASDGCWKRERDFFKTRKDADQFGSKEDHQHADADRNSRCKRVGYLNSTPDGSQDSSKESVSRDASGIEEEMRAEFFSHRGFRIDRKSGV